MNELILANSDFQDIRRLTYEKIDVDCGASNDFELQIESALYKPDIQVGAVVYSPGTEYGGIIGTVATDTSLDRFTFTGYTWRGLLDKKIIIPPSGQDYYRITSPTDLNTVISEVLEYVWGDYDCPFRVSEELTGVLINNYQFDRYISFLHGIRKMLLTKGYRWHIQYVMGNEGYIELSAAPIKNYATDEDLELSQDTLLDFKFKQVNNGVNHLVCLGQGELQERTVIDLYVQQDGTIGNTQYYFGLDEIADVYEDTNAENEDALLEYALERFEELRDSQTFQMNVESLGMTIEIGDIVGGRDYLSGLSMQQPVASIVWRQDNGIETIDYTLEGSE